MTCVSSLTDQIDVDVCVVGAGFAGLWAGYEAAKAGFQVAIIDAGAICGGASQQGLGLVQGGYSARLRKITERVGFDHARILYALSVEGAQMVHDFALQSGSLCPVSPTGHLHVTRHKGVDALQSEAELLRSLGAGVEVWPKERLRQAVVCEAYSGALFDAGAFSLDPAALTFALIAALNDRGVKLYDYTPAVRADFQGLRKIIETPQGRVRADHLVLCGSAALQGIAADLVPSLHGCIAPVVYTLGRVENLGSRLSDVLRSDIAVREMGRFGSFFRVSQGELIWSGAPAVSYHAPHTVAQRIVTEIDRRFPSLKPVFLSRCWSGVTGYDVHQMPIIGPIAPHVWVSTAFGLQGYNTSAIAGRLVARAMSAQDDEWRRFLPFGAVWTGGMVGRFIAEAFLVYERGWPR